MLIYYKEKSAQNSSEVQWSRIFIGHLSNNTTMPASQRDVTHDTVKINRRYQMAAESDMSWVESTPQRLKNKSQPISMEDGHLYAYDRGWHGLGVVTHTHSLMTHDSKAYFGTAENISSLNVLLSSTDSTLRRNIHQSINTQQIYQWHRLFTITRSDSNTLW